MNSWKCSQCGYTFEADQVPEKCPSCHETCSFLNVTCYIPECGAPDASGIDERLGDKEK